MKNDFAAIILSHGRPFNVITYDTLKKAGFTGRILILIDDEDKSGADYKKKYGNIVHVFCKKEVADRLDEGDNFNVRRSTIYPRLACFDLAKKLGIKYFVQLDDDYTQFQFRFNENLNYEYKNIERIDYVFDAMIEFLEASNAISVCFAQGGDFIGGEDCENASSPKLLRKAMNSFFCKTENEFKFLGKLNEDVNLYVSEGRRGKLFLTINNVALVQKQTQTNAGGMSDAYLDSGTYVKSFYTVMREPSCVKVGILHSSNKRIHHKVSWKNCVPKILDESFKK